MKKINLLFSIILFLTLVGCGGSGQNSTTNTTNTSNSNVVYKVKVIDGYIKNAIVSDGNGKKAEYESNGVYSFKKGIVPNTLIMAAGGVFEGTNLRNEVEFVGDANAKVLSPLSTFLYKNKDKKDLFLENTKIFKGSLNDDYIATNNKNLAKINQLLYVLQANGLDESFNKKLSKNDDFNSLFVTAKEVVENSKISYKENIKDFIEKVQYLSSDTNIKDYEKILIENKKLALGIKNNTENKPVTPINPPSVTPPATTPPSVTPPNTNPPATTPPVSNTNEAPKAVIKPISVSVKINEPILLDGSNSSDDKNIVKYEWFDGQKSLGSGNDLSTLVTSFEVIGAHKIKLVVTDDENAKGESSINIMVIAPENKAPNAVVNISNENPIYKTQVLIDGSASSDEDGVIKSYYWTDNGKFISSESKFEVSDLSVGEHIIGLVVTDNNGKESTMVAKTINVKPEPLNEPVAAISVYRFGYPVNTAELSQSLTLDAKDSRTLNAGASIEKYEWFDEFNGVKTSIGSGISITKNDFIQGLHTIYLTVTDSKGKTATTSFKLTIVEKRNLNPIARFKVENSNKVENGFYVIEQGKEIVFNASDSYDSDNNTPLTYKWYDNNTLVNQDMVYKTSDLSVGEHIIKLEVFDSKGAKNTDSKTAKVKVTELDKSPKAKITANKTSITLGTRVTLNASSSTAFNGRNITKYEWFENSHLLGEQAELSKNFTTLGEHIITLRVTDNENQTSETTISINVSKVLRTGQTTSYADYDDAWYANNEDIGVVRNFTKSGDIVTDGTTGKKWQDNKDVSKSSNMKTWDLAKNYCASLSLNGTGWRLPKLQEMFSLYDFSKGFPAENNAFAYKINDQFDFYWTLTKQDDINAYGFKFGRNIVSAYNIADLAGYIRCVRD